MQAVRAERKKAVPTRQKRRRQERKNRLGQRQPRRNRGGANQRACNEEQNLFRRKQGGKGGASRRRTRFSSGARAERVRKRETKRKKGSDSCRSLFFRLRGSEGCFPDRSALGRRGLRSRGISFPTQWENQAASVSANAALFFVSWFLRLIIAVGYSKKLSAMNRYLHFLTTL